MVWGFNDNKANNANSAEGVKPETEGQPEAQNELERVMAGAELPPPDSSQYGVLDLTDPKPRKRGRPKRSAEPELAKMDALFSPAGLGKLWVNAWNGIYGACGAEKLSPEEEKSQADIFAYWCKMRFPNTPEKYQPDILLAASLALSILPRLGPISKATAPWWKRMWARIRRKPEAIEPNA
jgi:hypothetical protein